jgi:hypothetical protein
MRTTSCSNCGKKFGLLRIWKNAVYGGVYPVLVFLTVISAIADPQSWWFIGCMSTWFGLNVTESWIPLHELVTPA